MTAPAAIALDIRLRLLAERGDDAAALVVPDVVLGSPREAADLAAFAAGCDVVTFDHELVDAAALAALEAAGRTIRPGAATVAVAQDKALQRARFAAAGLPIPPFRLLEAPAAAGLVAFGEAHGWPVVAKASRGGYDGRGVWILDGPAAAGDLVAGLTGAGEASPLLAEAWVPLTRELAVLVARRPGGETAVYPVVETVQRDGICRELRVPAPLPPALAATAADLGRRAAAAVGVVGILALELFLVGEGDGGRLVVNEIAARPHNSGHWTIEGAATSQFEQHLRAVLDWPLGSTDLRAPAVATINLLGPADGSDPRSRLRAALAVSGAHLHLYGKAARPGRKLGHATALGATAEEARGRAIAAAAALVGNGAGEGTA